MFDQYLRDVKVPTLEILKQGNKIKYRWSDCQANFNAPMRVFVDGNATWIYPTNSWKEYKTNKKPMELKPDPNFYVGYRELF
jgi:hypothetical protein